MPTAGAAKPAAGGVLVLAVNPEPPTLGSYFATSGPIHPIATKIHEGLLEYDFDLKPQPGLAESWSFSDDFKTATFKLRKGVFWHDGEPFTSADVQFTIMSVLKPIHPRGMIIFAPVVAVDTPDPHTAIIRMSSPNPAMMMGLSGRESPMVPKHILGSGDIRLNSNANQPVGTGPFRFVSWTRGSHIVLERNPKYWRAGEPLLDRLVFRFLPDAGGRAAAIQKGEVLAAGYNAIAPSDVKRLAASSGLEYSTRGYEMISPIALMEMNTRKKPFDNPRVRRALAHAIDRRFVIESVWFGFGKPATGPISSNFEKLGMYAPGYAFDFDPDKANRLLDEAGYRRDASGTRFEIWHDILPYGLEWKMLGEYVQQAFGAVGVRVKLRYEDVAQFMRRVYTNNDFDINSVWLSNQADPVLGVERTYTTAGIQKGVPLSNGSGYSNPEVDKLFAAARVESDPARRSDAYRRAQRLIIDDSPCIWIAEMEFSTVYHRRVRELIATPLGVDGSFRSTWLDKA